LLQFAIVAILVFVFADPKIRSRFTRVIKTLGKIARPVLAAVTAAAQQLEIASVKIDAAEEEIRGALPHAGRRTVLSRARCICLLSDKPLSLRELKKQILSEGHRTKAKDFSGYVRRVLRNSGQFVEVGGGWILRNSQ
jgi:hypothetical protein